MQRMQYIHVTGTTMMATAFVWNFPGTASLGQLEGDLAGAGVGDLQLAVHNTECLLQVSGDDGFYVGWSFMKFLK